MATHLFQLDLHHQLFQSSLSAHLTIFSRFSGPALPEPFWGPNNLGGIGVHPPIPFEMPPSVLSIVQFQHNLLFLAVFRVLNFRSRFEALNDIFWEK